MHEQTATRCSHSTYCLFPSKKGIVKGWKKRWFSLRGNVLAYYEQPPCNNCDGARDGNSVIITRVALFMLTPHSTHLTPHTLHTHTTHLTLTHTVSLPHNITSAHDLLGRIDVSQATAVRGSYQDQAPDSPADAGCYFQVCVGVCVWGRARVRKYGCGLDV